MEYEITPNLYAALLEWIERPFCETMRRHSLYTVHVVAQREAIVSVQKTAAEIVLYIDILLSKLQLVEKEKRLLDEQHVSLRRAQQLRHHHEMVLDDIKRRWDTLALLHGLQAMDRTSTALWVDAICINQNDTED